MKKWIVIFFATCGLLLNACSNNPIQNQNITHNNNASMAKYRVNFRLPKTQKWDLVSVEQDANGYAKSYRSASSRGVAADQSFYINYGRGIKTSLQASMHEVVSALGNTGCKRTDSKIITLNKNVLVFTASADQCMNGRTIWQVFKVFNMPDGQYSIVYSANPKAVPTKTREQMKTVVARATISAL